MSCSAWPSSFWVDDAGTGPGWPGMAAFLLRAARWGTAAARNCWADRHGAAGVADRSLVCAPPRLPAAPVLEHGPGRAIAGCLPAAVAGNGPGWARAWRQCSRGGAWNAALLWPCLVPCLRLGRHLRLQGDRAIPATGCGCSRSMSNGWTCAIGSADQAGSDAGVDDWFWRGSQSMIRAVRVNACSLREGQGEADPRLVRWTI